MIDVQKVMRHPETKRWHDVLGKYAKLSNYKNALDIGTASGLSAYTIAKNGKGKIYTIDVVKKNNIERFFNDIGLGNRIKFELMDSLSFFHSHNLKFEFISVDGSHWYKDVLQDARIGWKMLYKNGYMIFDDYEHPKIKFNVAKAVDEFANEMKLKLIVESGRAIIQKI